MQRNQPARNLFPGIGNVMKNDFRMWILIIDGHFYEFHSQSWNSLRREKRFWLWKPFEMIAFREQWLCMGSHNVPVCYSGFRNSSKNTWNSRGWCHHKNIVTHFHVTARTIVVDVVWKVVRDVRRTGSELLSIICQRLIATQITSSRACVASARLSESQDQRALPISLFSYMKGATSCSSFIRFHSLTE